jgi:hypothetical protein
MDCIYDKRPPHINTMMPRDSNALLAAMIASYAIPIGVVGWSYSNFKFTSISQIICKHPALVLGSMACMAAATCAYEHRRIKHAAACHVVGLYKIGFACIVLLLFCIFSLVSIDETHFVHYAFATLGFGAIVGFTCVHSILLQTPVCAAVAAVQFAACAHVMHRSATDGDIFWGEVAFIGAFALFYFYLHYFTHQRMADSAAICSSVSDVGNSIENRILRAPPLVTLISCMDPVIEQSLQLNL